MARAIWSGVISYGLVTIPVGLVSAVRQKEVHFRSSTAPTEAGSSAGVSA